MAFFKKRKIKPLKKAKKLLRKGHRFGTRINDNFADYLRADRRNAMNFRQTGRVRF